MKSGSFITLNKDFSVRVDAGETVTVPRGNFLLIESVDHRAGKIQVSIMKTHKVWVGREILKSFSESK